MLPPSSRDLPSRDTQRVQRGLRSARCVTLNRWAGLRRGRPASHAVSRSGRAWPWTPRTVWFAPSGAVL